jgi:hypothetical protein
METGNEKRIKKIDVQIAVHAKLGCEAEDMSEKHLKVSAIEGGKSEAFRQSVQIVDTVFAGFIKSFKDTKKLPDKEALILSTQKNIKDLLTRMYNNCQTSQLIQQGKEQAYREMVIAREEEVGEYEKQKDDLSKTVCRVEQSRKLTKERKNRANKNKNKGN